MDQAKPGYRSVLSQLASAIVDNGILYFVAIGSLLCVLALFAVGAFLTFTLSQAGIVVHWLRSAEAGHRTHLSVDADEPILQLARELERSRDDRRIAVLIPQLVKLRWYQPLLHLDRGRKLRTRLLCAGNPRLMVIDVPWMEASQS